MRALIAISLVWIAPLINENWLHGAVYGFGFVPRAEISQLAVALRAASKPDEDVIAPSFVCFEAGRRELIRFPETYGVYREAKLEYERDGFLAARRHLGSADFFQLISDTRHFWTQQMRDAIAGGKVSAVISDSPIQLLPLVLVPEDFLTSNGFHVALTTDHFTLWSRTPAPPPSSSIRSETRHTGIFAEGKCRAELLLWSKFTEKTEKKKIGVTGFEPATPASRTQCSGQAELHPVSGGA